MEYVARQLDVALDGLTTYGERAQTRTEHLRKIQLYLGFRPAGRKELQMLARWLLERALEHDKLTLLLQLACDHLYVQKIVRPGITVIERLVVTVRGRAQQVIFRRLRQMLTAERQAFLDELLVRDRSLGCTPLTWLRRSATSNSPAAIRNALTKLAFLRQQGIDDWETSQINPNRLKSLAQIGKRSTNQALQRSPTIRRYPILIAFCQQIYEEITDEVIDLYNRCLAQTYARARRDLEEFRLAAATAMNAKLRLFRELGSVVLDVEVADELVRECIYQRVSPQQLRGHL
ncbi:MAG: Tn3 family transposase TnAs3 [Chroococcidiopsis sp. SAG 2025]|nr:Tn3 family transposase TnAs3 [Chroococcidiopsis sp. SAG 2025]